MKVDVGGRREVRSIGGIEVGAGRRGMGGGLLIVASGSEVEVEVEIEIESEDTILASTEDSLVGQRGTEASENQMTKAAVYLE